MSWNKNNRAHTSLWFFEKWHHDRRDTQFIPAGEWETSFLIKSVAGDTPGAREKKALTHAEMLDGVFTNLFRASYEQGVDRDAAIDKMKAVLIDDSKRMKDLGDPVDECYQFLGE